MNFVIFTLMAKTHQQILSILFICSMLGTLLLPFNVAGIQTDTLKDTDAFYQSIAFEKQSKIDSLMKELLVTIQDKSMVEQKKTLDKELVSWMGDLDQVDDILVIGVQV